MPSAPSPTDATSRARPPTPEHRQDASVDACRTRAASQEANAMADNKNDKDDKKSGSGKKSGQGSGKK
jgi:hypothetical protein